MKKLLLSFLLISSLVVAQEKATLLYFNDSHVIYPVVDKHGERGGVARAKTLVDSVKKENKNTIVLQGGDLGGGVLFGAVYHGFPMIEAFNKMPIDISNFGQHEFDFGVTEARNLVNKSKFQWISTNLKESSGKPFNNSKEYIVKKIGDFKVGFLGTTDGMETTIQTTEIYQEDIIKSIGENLEKLKKEKVDFIVLLTQSEPELNIEILEKYPEINAVLAEEKSEKYNFVTYVGEKPIVSPQGNMGSIVKIDIFKNKDGKIKQSLEFLPVDNSVPSDKEMLKLEEFYKEKLDRDLGTVIAKNNVKLDSGFGENHHARYEESNVGNLIADAYKNHFNTEIAFMNGGGIRANIESGDFRLRDAISILPFSNKVGAFKYSGKTIVEALEHGVSSVDKKAGRFLQVSGMEYSYNPKNEMGSRVSNVTINGKPIQLETIYTVALPLYIKNGGDGFQMLKNTMGVVEIDSEKNIDSDIFIDYVKKIKVLNPKLEGRIVVK
ncbi:bifunctional UDP-sugar hydrolase/5'-nucleotidase [Cetobacterium sp. 2G large]|uniref:bifunctional metallophosphatase/5'-nucleotidase n=1 Tax=Cetobacterium sp. 2G large TaxID=2759680 RepID=UPI00163BF7AF|nr:bifunctional UDP-sugar hydrolase/5'-nucleotidase [Cetobacterium sp. 2G large]MBC2854487.1 bifunctional metallophosphatase/5'-nucleotidase [Cetobacterium sp. 2G large]